MDVPLVEMSVYADRPADRANDSPSASVACRTFVATVLFAYRWQWYAVALTPGCTIEVNGVKVDGPVIPGFDAFKLQPAEARNRRGNVLFKGEHDFRLHDIVGRSI